MAQRSAEIKARLAKYKIETESRVQTVKDFLKEPKDIMTEFGQSVLDHQTVSIMKDTTIFGLIMKMRSMMMRSLRTMMNSLIRSWRP